MNIWELLEIEPTTDKKAIRKAYAARTRVIHPEDKPEEFKLLRMAYEAALQFAEFTAEGGVVFENFGGNGPEEGQPSDESIDPPVEEQTPDPEGPEHSELFAYFSENQLNQKQRIDTFMQHWRELKNPNGDSEEGKWWQEYLDSEDFRSIRWNPQIVNLITAEIDDKFFYSNNELKIWFWNAYGFQADEEEKYQGEHKKLWKCLYPAYEYYQQMLLLKEYKRENKRNFRIFVVCAVVCIFVVVGIIVAHNFKVMDDERNFIIQYMAQQYTGTDFSVPERSEQGYDDATYTMHSSAHPELLITVKVEYLRRDDKSTMQVAGEDYGVQLLGYYAAQYGLPCGQTEYTEAGDDFLEKKLCGVLFYPDFEQIDAFCETITKMFDEQEELQTIQSVGICAENALFPEVFLQGGVTEFYFASPQNYDLRTIDAQELATQMKEAYIIYMFLYESWNLTLQQWGEWGTAYAEASAQWVLYRGYWYDMTDLNTGEVLCTFYIPTFTHIDYRDGIPSHEESVTVGNAYFLVSAQGVDVTENEDGSGFAVELNGEAETFGTEPTVRLNKVRLVPKGANENFMY